MWQAILPSWYGEGAERGGVMGYYKAIEDVLRVAMIRDKMLLLLY